MYIINGKFLARPINGQGRVAIEIIKELDRIVDPNMLELVAPVSPYSIEGLKNIKIIRIGEANGNGHIWEQTTFYRYLLRKNGICINFLNTHPLFRPDIAYIHDVLMFALPNLYSSFYGKLQNKYNVLMQKISAHKAKKIITVSDYSKNEIMKYLHISENRIEVIYNAWQHMNNVNADNSIFVRYPEIVKGNYYLAASGITPQKNFKWIIENAKNNPKSTYLIIGQKVASTQDDMTGSDNVIFTGRLSDEEMKALMSQCKAFIHPAIYEGFGMTPLEAAGCGCKKLIVADASCLPEIYEDYAYYIDPYDYSINLDNLIKEEKRDISSLLEKYSWEKGALQLKQVLDKLG